MMEAFDWLMEATTLKGVWRSATMTLGAQCVMTCGVQLTPTLCADSWVFEIQVMHSS